MENVTFIVDILMIVVLGCCFRDLVTKEDNLEVVLTKAFLELDKALVRHLHFSPNGKFLHVTCM